MIIETLKSFLWQTVKRVTQIKATEIWNHVALHQGLQCLL